MITIAVFTLAVATVVGVAGILAPGRVHSVSPRLLAMPHLVALLGLALLPAAAVACTGLGLLRAGGPGMLSAGCGPGGVSGWWWALLPGGAGAAALVPVVWQAVRLLRAARRTELTGAALAGAQPRHPPGGGVVWVLPAAEHAAHTCGLRHPHAVVTTGLLALLDPAEQQAVCAHEAAHLRLGHPRLLLLGAAIARAYRLLPPVRQAWSGLRRELEAAADDEAARAVGTRPLLSALARVALTRATSPHVAGFADPEHLRYRLARLQHPQPRDPRASALIIAAGLALLTTLAWASCALATGAPAAVGLAACATALAAAGLRPLWPMR